MHVKNVLRVRHFSRQAEHASDQRSSPREAYVCAPHCGSFPCLILGRDYSIYRYQAIGAIVLEQA